jgi:hypothetical protein
MSPFAGSAQSLDIDIALQPKQDRLYDLAEHSPFTNLGYGGRRGGGKSGGLRRVLISRRLKHAETNGILVRRTYTELYQNHIEPLFREFPYMRDWWVEKHKYLAFPNGSKQYFGYAQHEIDVDKLFGSDFGDIGVEEAGLFSQRELEKMKGSNRWPRVPEFTAKMFYSFMPGGRSHFYLKRIFIDRDFLPDENGSSYTFIEAYGWDNIEWCRKQLIQDGISDYTFYEEWTNEQRKAYFWLSDYAKQLLSITDEQLRQAWLEGNWDQFEGVVFPELREDIHNLDRFAPAFDGQGCKLVSALDWAATGTTAATQAAVDPAENLFVFDEYCVKNRLVSEHTEKILEMLTGHGKQEYTLMDLPVNVLNQQDMASIQREFMLAGLFTVQAHRAHIEMGVNLLREYLKIDPNRVHPFTGQLGSPRIFISKRRCPNVWKQMKELQRVIDLETGKVKFIGEDDALDTVRYEAMSRPQAPAKKLDFTPEQFVAHAKTYTSMDSKVARTFGKFDKAFGKEPDQNEWFPKG